MMKKRFFTLLELSCAMALLLLLLTLFFSLLGQMKRSNQLLINESAAICALHNTAERFAVRRERTADTVEKIFREEFSAACFPPRYTAKTQRIGRQTLMQIIHRNKGCVAQWRVTCDK